MASDLAEIIGKAALAAIQSFSGGSVVVAITVAAELCTERRHLNTRQQYDMLTRQVYNNYIGWI